MKSILFTSLALTASGVLACPDYELYGARHSLTGEQLFAEQTFTVTAGGDQDLTQCSGIQPQGGGGSGSFTTSPDFSFELSGLKSYSLTIKTMAEGCDTVLLVNTADATWYYDDDSNGDMNALINLPTPSDGWIDVWVGTFDGSFCEATLSLETFYR